MIVDRVRADESLFELKPALIEQSYSCPQKLLWERVDRLSRGLLSRGLIKGDAVMAWLPNCHEAIETELAVLQCGFAWVNLNARMTWMEVAGVIEACKPKVLITDRAGLEKLDKDAGRVPPVILIGEKERTARISTAEGGRATNGIEFYEDVIASSLPDRPDIQILEDDIARLRYTSGTTGTAKAAVLPHRVYLASLENLQNELHPLTSDDRVLHVAPLTHASGALVYPILAAGGANVLINHFDAEEVLEIIERERITTMFLVPTILHRLSQSPGFKTRDLSSLKTVFYGGAPMATEQLLPALDRLGHALVHIYGLSEAPWPITTLRHAEHGRGSPKLGSIGRPTKICQVKILDEWGRSAAPGKVGELFVSGRNVMSGYWNDEAATSEVLRDGWLATGDLGYCDPDGFYWIVDRKKDVIISGGFNVYAKEIELALCEHPGIGEAAVVGVPNGDWGEMVTAYISPRAGVKLRVEEIGEWCRRRLSNYKCPKRIEILAELPKNSSGKIQKRSLAETRPLPPGDG